MRDMLVHKEPVCEHSRCSDVIEVLYSQATKLVGLSCLSNSILYYAAGQTPMHDTNISKRSAVYIRNAHPLNDIEQVLHVASSCDSSGLLDSIP
jgi:hypothetical protein